LGAAIDLGPPLLSEILDLDDGHALHAGALESVDDIVERTV